MGNVQFKDNKILFVNNKIAMHEDCCCDTCPVDCSGCDSSYTVDISGFTGTCGTFFNGTHTVENDSDCMWVQASGGLGAGDAPGIILSCYLGIWSLVATKLYQPGPILYVYKISGQIDAKNCPDDTYDMHNVLRCSGQTGTAVVS